MNNGFFRFYLLAVCFASLMCGSITSGFLAFNVIKYALPLSTIDPARLEVYSSNESFSRSKNNPVFAVGPPIVLSAGRAVSVPESAAVELSEAELDAARLKARGSLISSHKFRARQGIILQVIIIVICTLLFLPHWKFAVRLRADA